MKKLLLIIGLAGLLSMPSVVFAEAAWYGSFRAGVASEDGTTGVKDFYSRFGLKGTSEISEGLSANYRYEQDINLANAKIGGGRLSYVGLSGGFGTISIGQIWSASYNMVGSMLDNSWIYGSGGTSARIGSAVSYSNSVGAANLQIDLVMDGANEAKSGVDQYEFGLSMDLGAATLAFAHRKKYVDAQEGKTLTGVTEGDSGTATSLVAVVDGDDKEYEVTQIMVDPGMGGSPEVMEVAASDVTELDPTSHMRLVSLDDEGEQTTVTTAAAAGELEHEIISGTAVTQVQCALLGSDEYTWFDWDGGAGGEAAACYKAENVVDNILKSVKASSAEDAEAAEAIENIADAAACTTAAADNQWEALEGKCYAAAAVITYIHVAQVDAVPATATTIEVTVKGEDGEDKVLTDPTIKVKAGDGSSPAKAVYETDPTAAYDESMNAFAVKVAAGSHSAALGLVKTSKSDGTDKSRTIANVGGPLSDGLSYYLQVHDVKDSKDNPWLIGLQKSLDGGSSVVFEHHKEGDATNTALMMMVNF